MVSKEVLGKRIAAFRMKCGLTQTQLADRVFVSTQAVSKWELGSSIPSIDVLLQLSNIFGCTINDLVEEQHLLEKIAKQEYSFSDGIYFFIPDSEANCRWSNQIVQNDMIRRNWRDYSTGKLKTNVSMFVNSRPGTILEIGAGPGGGFFPSILHDQPERQIIISDLSPAIVREWRKLLEYEKGYHNLIFAVFNFCNIPFRDDSIEIITDGGGINNTILGDKYTALKEVHRVLVPGGVLISGGGYISKNEEKRLPERLQKDIKEKYPQCLDNDSDTLMELGFSKVETVVTGGWNTKDDISEIATLANRYNENIHFTGYIRYCYK